jgi:hypothetical protein
LAHNNARGNRFCVIMFQTYVSLGDVIGVYVYYYCYNNNCNNHNSSSNIHKHQ